MCTENLVHIVLNFKYKNKNLDMPNYIEKIPDVAVRNILNAIKQYRKGEFKDNTNLPKAIAAILETAIKDKEMQEFAVENYSQLVGILIDKQPEFLAIKKDIEGKFYFQVNNEIIGRH